MKNQRRNSIESMYEYDMPNSHESGYHSTYLKMVGTTIALTFIGIIVFIELEKSGTFAKPEPGQFTEQTQMSSNIGQPVFEPGVVGRGRPFKHLHEVLTKYAHSNKQYDLQQKLLEEKSSISSKRVQLRHHLKQILELISDLQSYQE